jgi:hypothetical protein
MSKPEDIPEDVWEAGRRVINSGRALGSTDPNRWAELVARAILADRASRPIPALEAMGEWQDIETAPKDWSDILLHVPNLKSDFRTVCEGYFDREDMEWRAPGFGVVAPAAWRPLPTPPIATLQQGAKP